MQIEKGTIVELKGSLSLIGGYTGPWEVVQVQGSWLELEPADPKVREEEYADGLGRSYGYGCELHEIKIIN